MFQITYSALVVLISLVWILLRACICVKQKGLDRKRELQLMLVYICIVVVARFTFFPFGTVSEKIQPLIFDAAKMFPFAKMMKLSARFGSH